MENLTLRPHMGLWMHKAGESRSRARNMSRARGPCCSAMCHPNKSTGFPSSSETPELLIHKQNPNKCHPRAPRRPRVGALDPESVLTSIPRLVPTLASEPLAQEQRRFLHLTLTGHHLSAPPLSRWSPAYPLRPNAELGPSSHSSPHPSGVLFHPVTPPHHPTAQATLPLPSLLPPGLLCLSPLSFISSLGFSPP